MNRFPPAHGLDEKFPLGRACKGAFTLNESECEIKMFSLIFSAIQFEYHNEFPGNLSKTTLLSCSLFAQCKLTLMLDLQLLNITAGRQKLKAKINLNPTYKQNKEKRVASLIDNQPGWCNTYYLTEHEILRAMWCNKAGDLEVENVITVTFFCH